MANLMMSRWTTAVLIAAGICLEARPAAARQASQTIIEAGVGQAWFVDESPIRHDVVGAGARWYVTPRLAIGPEFTFMRGPGIDHDWFVTGNATFDLSRPSRAFRRVVPYLVGGGGYTRMRTAVGTGPYYSSEGTFTGGAGVRISSQPGWFVAPEFRLGWELHSRVGVMVGIKR